MTAFTAATLPGVVAPAGADFDAVLCDSARLGPARTKTNADSVAKAGIHLTKHRAPRGPASRRHHDSAAFSLPHFTSPAGFVPVSFQGVNRVWCAFLGSKHSRLSRLRSVEVCTRKCCKQPL